MYTGVRPGATPGPSGHNSPMTADSTRGLTTYTLTVCPTCRVGWPEGDEPTCSVLEEHQHVPFEAHRHRTPVMLPSGAELWAVSFDASDPYSRDRAPDFGLYLDEKWAPPWEHAKVRWPDFGVPSELDVLRDQLCAALVRAKAGDLVEIGCLGGARPHGHSARLPDDHRRPRPRQCRRVGQVELLRARRRDT